VAESEPVHALIERIVAGARIPNPSEREDLRRELLTHFEEANASPHSVDYAIRRFGDEASVTDLLRRVYRWDYAALYLAKVVASIVVSFAAALAIVAAFNLRLELETEVWRLAPGFSRGAGLALAVTFGLIAVSEFFRRPFNRSRAMITIAGYAAVCAVIQLFVPHSASELVISIGFVLLGCICGRLPSRSARWLLTFVAFAAGEYGIHAALRVSFPPSRAAMAGAILVTVWASTVVILRYADAAFMQRFDAAPR